MMKTVPALEITTKISQYCFELGRHLAGVCKWHSCLNLNSGLAFGELSEDTSDIPGRICSEGHVCSGGCVTWDSVRLNTSGMTRRPHALDRVVPEQSSDGVRVPILVHSGSRFTRTSAECVRCGRQIFLGELAHLPNGTKLILIPVTVGGAQWYYYWWGQYLYTFGTITEDLYLKIVNNGASVNQGITFGYSMPLATTVTTVTTTTKYHVINDSTKFHVINDSTKYHAINDNTKYFAINDISKYNIINDSTKYYVINDNTKFYAINDNNNDYNHNS
ncbi:hypothetical protein DPMN_022538 [Dreissena polymorpha]|uniref:Uncharacterized protein n=1 Tax=Dreissena polymorpha TaxID=45954 RepID=A0A9D4NNS9_DREPO|nr:hypothetical protein DPMN_022538 [Dreissena polymorpha]